MVFVLLCLFEADVLFKTVVITINLWHLCTLKKIRMNLFFSIENALPRVPGVTFSTPFNWQVQNGEIWAVAGSNGSGKSLLAELIIGQYGLNQGEIIYHFLDELQRNNPEKTLHAWEFIKLVSFNSTYSIVDFRPMYYQQRFNSTEANESPFVRDLLIGDGSSNPVTEEIIKTLNIAKLLDRKLIQLSSGELRKLLIAKIMASNPQMLIFDNPFIGLDVASRHQLNELFVQMNRQGIQLLFLVPAAVDLPDCTEKVLVMNQCRMASFATAQEYRKMHQRENIRNSEIHIDWATFQTPEDYPEVCREVVKMENIEISYGKQIIRQDVNWIIQKGEKWALLGPNGSGKSTLLSYIFADNPQSYAKKLTLFDRRRGTGESIWEIKTRIGFTSSEMHLYYRENVPCLSVVASGFFDSVGLFRKCSDKQEQAAVRMLEILECTHLKDKPFLKISSGEQRLVLFARSLVKNPELLILDEPFHGLDTSKKRLCRRVVESYCAQPDKSLIYVTHRREEIPTCIDHYMELD
ncbi:MAG: molybdenum transporter ATP-binding protein [Bacteroidetes bacterium]|nr:molybdenum transporter ATP-binding protein [Bacteroidota bacterium]